MSDKTKNLSNGETKSELTLEFLNQIKKPAPINSFGTGSWWYPTSAELESEEHPFNRLLNSGQQKIFRKLTFLCFVNKTWLVRAVPEFISDIMGRNPAPKTVEVHFKTLRKYKFMELRQYNKNAGNVYLINSILMATYMACDMQFYNLTQPMVEYVRKYEAEERVAQTRNRREISELTSKPRPPMTEQERQLTIQQLKADAAKAEAAKENFPGM